VYGYFIDPEATAYLAEIGKVSREYATAVVMAERDRSDRVRVWMHEVLEELAWRPHQNNCCPLVDPRYRANIEVRARGCYRAIVDWLAMRCDEEDTIPLDVVAELEPWEVARAVHDWPALATHIIDCYDEANARPDHDTARISEGYETDRC